VWCRPRRCSCRRQNLRSAPASTSRPGQLIAGFEVSINCRFWVSTEEELRNSALVGIKQKGRDFQFVLFHVISGVTKKVYNAYRFSLIFHPLYKLRLLQPPSVMPKDIYEDIVVCSMQTGSLRRLRSGLPSLHVGEIEGTLRHDFEYEFARPGQVVNAVRHVTFHVLDTSARLATLSAFLDNRFRRQLSLTRGKSPRVHR